MQRLSKLSHVCRPSALLAALILCGCSGPPETAALPNQPSNYEEKRKLIEQNGQLKPEQKQMELAKLDAMEKAKAEGR